LIVNAENALSCRVGDVVPSGQRSYRLQMPEITYTTAIPFCFHTILTLRQKLTGRYDGGLVTRPSWERSTNDTRDNIHGMVRPKGMQNILHSSLGVAGPSWAMPYLNDTKEMIRCDFTLPENRNNLMQDGSTISSKGSSPKLDQNNLRMG
jgi:hypothetical protein